MNSLGFAFESTYFRAIKYSVYLALLANVFLFLAEEIASATALNVGVTTLASVFQIYSTTIDTAAWLILLLFFELETHALSDRLLRGSTGRLIHLVRLLCLATISVACWGYFAEFAGLLASEPLVAATCGAVDSSWSVLVDLDRFTALDVDPCVEGGWLVLTGYERVLATSASYQSALLLAATDFINAAAWILVVIVLEIEVRSVLAVSGSRVSGVALLRPLKLLLYFVLFAAAVYWGFEGDFLDFWDAVLWLFAFFVIEQNLVSWKQETKAEMMTASSDQAR